MTDYEALGQRVKQGRLAQGWTQRELGDRVGEDQPMVTNMERGKRGDVPEATLARYAAVLGLSLPYLRYGLVVGTDAGILDGLAFARGWQAAMARAAAALADLAAQPDVGPTVEVSRDVAALGALGAVQQDLAAAGRDDPAAADAPAPDAGASLARPPRRRRAAGQ